MTVDRCVRFHRSTNPVMAMAVVVVVVVQRHLVSRRRLDGHSYRAISSDLIVDRLPRFVRGVEPRGGIGAQVRASNELIGTKLRIGREIPDAVADTRATDRRVDAP